MNSYRNLLPGDPAPWFHCPSTGNPNYAFDTVAGRYVILCFYGSAGHAPAALAVKSAINNRDLLNDAHASFFGVSNDPADRDQVRVAEMLPGIRHFWDFNGEVGKTYGALPVEFAGNGPAALRPIWVVLDPTLRVLKIFPFEADSAEGAKVFSYIRSLPPPGQFAGTPLQAPVLYLPNVFEPELCNKLIAIYDADGGVESGFMRDVGGKTVAIMDHHHKRRRDFNISDPELIKVLQERISRRVVPEILKIHQFKVTRMERYLVGCYTAEDGGHFNAHRDNTTKGTAHRRFAVSVNLNSEFEGGEVSFPEYGPRSFKAPAGGAVVFSCSLLHAVSKVTSGKRYAFLPFLYDDAAAKIREENNAFLDKSLGKYQTAAPV
jgi:predicted 2-oxoglutarate/Fe(II)-dependent dioxygenase YbiX/peroxiredoxin